MRKINKSTHENQLMIYASENPDAKWNDFRDYDQGNVYKKIKTQIFDEQSDLCAYCETSLNDSHDNNKRVEHFKSKSGEPKGGLNIHLDWFNLLGVCVGGSDYESKKSYELPANLSCDSYKAHLESLEKIIDKDWHGRVLFPLDLPEPHQLFSFDKMTGMLTPNKAYCAGHTIEPNQFETTEQLVEETIRVFNLNCDRLSKARLKVFHFFQKQIRVARQTNDIGKLKRLTISWKREKPLSFQTTRDIMLTESPITSRFL